MTDSLLFSVSANAQDWTALGKCRVKKETQQQKFTLWGHQCGICAYEPRSSRPLPLPSGYLCFTSPSGMTKQQPQSLCAFLLKGCHHVSVQWGSVPAETTQWKTFTNLPSVKEDLLSVSELCHLGCHLLPVRAAPEVKHEDAQWLCLCSPAPLQQLPSQTAWL